MILNHLHLLLAAGGNSCGTNNGFFPGIYDGLCQGGNVQISGLGDVVIIIANVIRILETLAGGLAVVGIIVAGIMYVTSAGDPKRVSRAKTVLSQSIIGLVIIIVAYALVTFIAGSF